MSRDTKQPTIVERFLDVSVFAPLGFLLEGDEVVPKLAEAGRRQVRFSRSLGRVAIAGLVRSTKREAAAEATQRSSAVDTSTPGPDPTTRATVAAVDGYDDLTARESIAVIAGCSDEEAAWIRDRELSTKNRVTVIRALDARNV